jgi:phosphatidylserine synthase
MKKDMIFAPAMLLICILLFLYGATGLAAHIVISVIGILILAVYTSTTRREWKTPALEILMRAFYGIALLTGIVANATDIAALDIVHKVSAALFAVLLVVLFVKKLVARKK